MARKQPKQEPESGWQPGRERALVKLPRKTHQILKWVAALRGLTQQQTIHALLLEEVQRSKDHWRDQIDKLVENADLDGDEDE